MSELKFIELHLGNMLIHHGYDAENKEVMQEVVGQQPARKLVALSRVQSVTEKYVLLSSGYGRFIYWEYHDGYEKVMAIFKEAGLLIQARHGHAS
jgi:hypothetical protein